MTQSEISALKEKAQKATPKERWHEIDIVTNRRVDAEYIAAAHPQAILALVEMNEKMRTALENIRDIADDDRMNADCIARHVLAEVKA